MGRILMVLILAAAACPVCWADSAQVDRAQVTVEHRGGRDWCVLDAQVSMVVPVSIDDLAAVITDFGSYPSFDEKIHEIRAEAVPGAVILTEKVVVSALGIENTNRFSLRMVSAQTSDNPRTETFTWTLEKTDGSIDSITGSWVLEARGTETSPLTKLTYRNTSAVPKVIFGEEAFLGLFLGGEYRAFVEAVVKKAGSK